MMIKLKGKKLLILITIMLMGSLWSAEPLGASLAPDEEIKLGDQFLSYIKSQYELVENPYVVQYINELGDYLGRNIEVPYFSLSFYLIKENIINAFASLGGHIFLFSDIVLMLDSVDELACILTHELGHVSARHLANRMERSKRIAMATMAGVLAGILVGGKAAGPLVTGSIASAAQAELGYSREDERQADQIGFKLTDISGFNPSGMVTVLKKIQREHWYSGDSIPSYLQTHPGAPERMANIEAMLQGYEKKPDTDKTKHFRSRFPLFQTMVTALCMEPSSAKMEFVKRLRLDPKSPLPLYGLGLVLEREGKITEAIDSFGQALSGNPEFIEAMFSMGYAYISNGQYEDSLSVARKALALAPRDKEILYLYALSLQKLERNDKAASIYERLTYLPPVNNMVYYNLGLVYGRQGNLAQAHYNLGIYFAKLNEKEKALFHFKKAEELSADKPALQEKIRSALKNFS
jgi:beta-barrel assembly-enhancing protease